MDLKSLENKPLIQLSVDERKAIMSAYLAYFDTLRPRERLLGYCVVYCGISAKKVGEIDIGFKANADEQCSPQCSLFFGEYEMLIFDNKFEGMIFDYLATDERFMQYMNNASYPFPTDSWLRLPLFAPQYHGKTERLHDCRTFIANAGKAIGFNAKHIILHKLTRTPYFKTAFVMHKPTEARADCLTLKRQ